MITFNCPCCGKSFSVGDEFAGRKAKCPAPKCGTPLIVPAATQHPPSSPAASTSWGNAATPPPVACQPLQPALPRRETGDLRARLETMMREEEQRRIGISSMTESQQEALAQWGMRMFQLGAAKVGEIEEIKFDGRLIVLDDGSRWEVSEVDSSISDMWSPTEKVVILDDEMYKLDESEMVSVEEHL